MASINAAVEMMGTGYFTAGCSGVAAHRKCHFNLCMSFRESLPSLEIELTSNDLWDPASRKQNKPDKTTLQSAVVSPKDPCLSSITLGSLRLLLGHSGTGDYTMPHMT